MQRKRMTLMISIYIYFNIKLLHKTKGNRQEQKTHKSWNSVSGMPPQISFPRKVLLEHSSFPRERNQNKVQSWGKFPYSETEKVLRHRSKTKQYLPSIRLESRAKKADFKCSLNMRCVQFLALGSKWINGFSNG